MDQDSIEQNGQFVAECELDSGSEFDDETGAESCVEQVMEPQRIATPSTEKILPTPAVPQDVLQRKWGIRSPGQLRDRCVQLDCGQYLINPLLRQRTLSILVGDSGLGKSPFLYQAALCVASGLAFLDWRVSKGRVLYLDFENGLADVNHMVSRLCGHLGLTSRPQENLLLWNFNDLPTRWKPADLGDMAADVQPDWIIIDSVGAFAPQAEEKAFNVTQTFQALRELIRNGTSVTLVHHIKKPSTKPSEPLPALPEAPKKWLNQARGSGALINGTDVRIGLEWFKAMEAPDLDGQPCEAALVLAGYARVHGNIPTTYIARVLGEDDEPQGYRKLSGVNLLFNEHQREREPEQLPF